MRTLLRTKTIAFALALSTAAHASLLAASIARRAPAPANEVSSAFEVNVEATPPDSATVPVPDPPAAPSISPHAASRRPLAAPPPAPSMAKADNSSQPSKPEMLAMRAAAPGLPRFAISLPSAGAGGVIATSPVAAHSRESAGNADLVAEGEVDVPARLRWSETPRYPPEALADGLEGEVQLELVVSTAGTVESVHVLAPAGHRFDEVAVASARRFRFTPAVKDGRPVRVRLRWTVGFRLR